MQPTFKGRKDSGTVAVEGMTSWDPSLSRRRLDTSGRNVQVTFDSNFVVGCHKSCKTARGAPMVTHPDDDEVDTRDTFSASDPMHLVGARAIGIVRGSSSSSNSKPPLTLSAFRRPEHTIRLTDSDPARKLEAAYDLHSVGCCVLGHGAFSTVRLAIRRRDGVKVAVKSIAKHDALRSRRLRPRGERDLEEWEILGRLENHPYVITLLDVFETDEEIQLVTEYCAGGELFDAIQKKRNRSHSMRRGQYTEPQAACITKQILRALKDLHAADLVHRDVKPENILLAGNDDSAIHVKLCDFGVARSIVRKVSPDSLSSDGDVSPLTPGRSRAYSNLGSDYYVAPEVCYGTAYGTSVDIFSLGVTVYILLCGFPPVFSGSDRDAHVMFPKSFWKDISENAKELVRLMLNPDPASRISAREALHHEWISGREDVGLTPPRRVETNRTVNLDLVRTRLYNSLAAKEVAPKRRTPSAIASVKKRARTEKSTRTSSALMALADLYRGVATSKVIVSKVVDPTEEAQETRCRNGDELELDQNETLESSFGSSLPALTVKLCN